jgi:hypothetical protein
MGMRYSLKHTIYSPTGVVTLGVIPPLFVQYKDSNTLIMKQTGKMLLEFSGVKGATQDGTYTYDWAAKTSLALNTKELGDIIALAQETGCEFFRPGEPERKLSVSRSPDGSGITMVLDSHSNNGLTSVNVSVPWGEYVVMETLFRHSIPVMIGFDKMTASPPSLGQP